MTVRVTARMLAAHDYFISHGYADAGAPAIVGNGCGESGPELDSTFDRMHADHGSGGFLEWRDSHGSPRKTRLAAFADARGQGLRDDLFTQCDYAIWELGKSFPVLDQQLRNPGGRSIANLTANFCWQFENPAPATAGLDRRIEYAEAVAARAAEIKAAVQRPAPVPQAPMPQLPSPAAPLPRWLPDLPPISASTAGRRAAFRDSIGAACDALEAERAAFNAEIDAEIAALKKTATEFLDGSAPPGLQPTGADSAPSNRQRTHTMFGPNWVTSVFGAGSIAGAVATVILDLVNKQTPDVESLSLIFSSLMAGLGLIQAKDKSVTGGTIPATPEAKRRVGA